MVDEFVMCGVVGHIFVRCPTTIGTSINEGVGSICTPMLHPPPRVIAPPSRDKNDVRSGSTLLWLPEEELDKLLHSPSRQEQVEEVEEENVEKLNGDDPHVNPIEEYLSGAPSVCSTVEEDMDGGELGEEGLRAADDLYSDDIENMVEPTENNIILEQHKGKALENIVWGIARAYTVVEHGRCMGKLKELSDGAWAWMKAIPFNLLCRAYFDHTAKCEHLTNIFSESFNSWMIGLRDLPVCQFIEKLHLKIVTLMFNRRKKAREWSVDDVVPRAKKLHESHKVEYHKYIYRGVIDSELGIASNIWSVKTIHSRWVVNLDSRTCECMVWQLSEMPCVHVSLLIDKQRWNWESFCHTCFKISSYIDTYKDHITPFSHMSTWDNSISRVLPPPLRRPPGRPKEKLCYEAKILRDEAFLQRALSFYRLIVAWLVGVVGVYKMPLPPTFPMEFTCMPEHFVEDTLELLIFTSRTPKAHDGFLLDDFLNFIIMFMASPEYIRNPYLRAKMVKFLNCWMPHRSGSASTTSLFELYQLSLQYLVHDLLKLYVDIEFIGSHTQFYDKFNILHNIANLLEYLWQVPIHRNAWKQIAKEEKGVYLNFLNFLINDSIFLLDESLTKILELKDMAMKKNKMKQTLNSSFDGEICIPLEEQVEAQFLFLIK
ncbi:hypothetical protein GIB67_034834 [Kingdonia uniflora]|uniref:SWIM-type domain-containing protein n=1 Tax=Kingdonia uniflora TaxID=39325 RepID=A0A7J7ME79_9MAGN|nr:hypothetical protein GIB67_034834 [Kingdonia uniflora]